MDSSPGQQETEPAREHQLPGALRRWLLPRPLATFGFGLALVFTGHWFGTTGMLLLLLSTTLLTIIYQLIDQQDTGDVQPSPAPLIIDEKLTDSADEHLSPTLPAASPNDVYTPQPGGELAGARILLVTNDTADRHELKNWLCSWGAEVTLAANPARSLYELIKGVQDDTPFRAAIVDQGQLGTSSDQLAILIRSEPRLQDLPLIHIASPHSEQRQAGLRDAGYSRLLSVPVDKTLLYTALHDSAEPATGDPRVVRLIDRYTSSLSRQPLSILLADNSRSDRHRTRSMLKRMGHEVFVADDGIRILDALDGHRFDLAIVSLELKQANGLETFKLHHFTRSGQTEVPFIMLLEEVDRGTLQACELAGVQGMLIKPLDSHKLSQTVESVVRLTQKRNHAALGDHTSSNLSLGAREINGVLLDTQRLTELDRLGGSPDFLEKLIRGLATEGRKLLHQTEEAAAARNIKRLRDLGQALSDSAGNLGAFELHRSSLAASRFGIHDSPQKALDLVKDIRRSHDSTEKALQEFLSECDHTHHM